MGGHYSKVYDEALNEEKSCVDKLWREYIKTSKIITDKQYNLLHKLFPEQMYRQFMYKTLLEKIFKDQLVYDEDGLIDDTHFTHDMVHTILYKHHTHKFSNERLGMITLKILYKLYGSIENLDKEERKTLWETVVYPWFKSYFPKKTFNNDIYSSSIYINIYKVLKSLSYLEMNHLLIKNVDLSYGDEYFSLISYDVPYQYTYSFEKGIQYRLDTKQTMKYIRFYDLCCLDIDDVENMNNDYYEWMKKNLKMIEVKSNRGIHILILEKKIHHTSCEFLDIANTLGCDPWYIRFSYNFGYKLRKSKKFNEDKIIYGLKMFNMQSLNLEQRELYELSKYYYLE